MASYSLVLDSGAISALATEKIVRVAALKALRQGLNVVVPTVVVAESTTGSARDGAVNRLLKAAQIADCTLPVARTAAQLRHAVGAQATTVDAIVVATADHTPGSIILTGDVRDLRPLAAIHARSTVVGLDAKR